MISKKEFLLRLTAEERIKKNLIIDQNKFNDSINNFGKDKKVVSNFDENQPALTMTQFVFLLSEISRIDFEVE